MRGSRPNIVLILADDMGFSDIGCYGSEIDTPNLDSLAASGLRFTQMYNCARCCPSRASLLTGLSPHQAGVGHMVEDRGLPGYRGFLNDNCVTIAEALRSGGYQTYMAGKWHVGGPYSPLPPEEWYPGKPGFPLPIQRGFDHHFGTLGGGGSYYHPPTLIEDDALIAPGEDFYYTDAISDRAAEMIGDAAAGEEPFFLYVAYTAPHWPLHAWDEDIAKYEGRYRSGWDELRRKRYERLKELGVIDSQWAMSPRDDEASCWTQLSEEQREWEALRMAVYAAQIDRMDQGIGRILRKLRDLGIADNTMVMFAADNGGCAEFLAEDGSILRYDLPTRQGGKVRVGNIPGLRPGPEETFMSYDLPWANASNTPFRRYKHWVHEGGIATPFIVHWPEAVKPGGMAHQSVHFQDIMATCLDAAGLGYPAIHNGHLITPMEGESFLPLFEGDDWRRQNPIVWEHEGNKAVRRGKWKLVRRYPESWELYNMEKDRTELNDLAGENPSLVHELAAIYERWAERCGVVERK